MSYILDRVKSNIHCCGIEVSFGAIPQPSIIAGWQPFYNTIYNNYDFKKAYAGLSSIDFSEESNLSTAGYSYKIKVSFRFPATDANRTERIELLHKIKFINVLLTDGRTITVGRNDYFQNTAPIIKTKTNEQLCEVELEVTSIVSAGFTPTQNAFGLPVLIPFSI